jgi:hypothetical protein
MPSVHSKDTGARGSEHHRSGCNTTRDRIAISGSLKLKCPGDTSLPAATLHAGAICTVTASDDAAVHKRVLVLPDVRVGAADAKSNKTLKPRVDALNAVMRYVATPHADTADDDVVERNESALLHALLSAHKEDFAQWLAEVMGVRTKPLSTEAMLVVKRYTG